MKQEVIIQNILNTEILDFQQKKIEIEMDYNNFILLYEKQKQNFHKISHNNMDNFSELFNFITYIFDETGVINETELLTKCTKNTTKSKNFQNNNLMLALITKQKNLIEEIYDFSLNPLRINKPALHDELRIKMLEKFSAKVEQQETLLKNIAKENERLRKNLDLILRKTLVRNLPDHSSIVNKLSECNHVISKSNLYPSICTKKIDSQLNSNEIRQEKINYIIHEEKKVEKELDHISENLEKYNIDKSSNNQEINKTVDLQISSLIEEKIKSNPPKITKRLTNKISEYINQRISQDLDIITHEDKDLQNNLSNKNSKIELLNKNISSNTGMLSHSRSNSFLSKIEKPPKIHEISQSPVIVNKIDITKLPLKEENMNIISSKGVKMYIKTSRKKESNSKEKNLECDFIKFPNHKYLKEDVFDMTVHDKMENIKCLKKNHKAFTPLRKKKSNSSCSKSYKKTLSPDKYVKKVLVVNRKRYINRSNYGMNVAKKRENANKIQHEEENTKINLIYSSLDPKSFTFKNISENMTQRTHCRSNSVDVYDK